MPASLFGPDLSSLGQLGVNAVGPLAAAGLNTFLAGQPGVYRTYPVSTLPPAIYSLAIRGAAVPFLPFYIYTFPISPSNVRKEVAGMANYYDVAGDSASLGVQRIADVYGLSPPTFTIQGTTGVKYHSTDGYLWTGLESILILQAALAQYFALVAEAGGSVGFGSSELPRLEWYDYFTSAFWQVVPMGPQGIYQDSASPQLLFYRYRLVAIQNLEAPLAEIADGVLGAISDGINAGISGLGQSLGSALGSYSPFGVD